jgi:Type I phosphodiesterase / nucleotide pyrophosphatase
MGNRWFGSVVVALVVLSGPTALGLSQHPSHNLVLFVAEGLRPVMVNDQTAPALAALMKNGVHFTDTHSMFPTITTVNAASMVTGTRWGTQAISATGFTSVSSSTFRTLRLFLFTDIQCV